MHNCAQHAFEVQLQELAMHSYHKHRKKVRYSRATLCAAFWTVNVSFGKRNNLMTKGLLGHYNHLSYWMVGQVNSRKMADDRPLLNFTALGLTMKNKM